MAGPRAWRCVDVRASVCVDKPPAYARMPPGVTGCLRAWAGGLCVEDGECEQGGGRPVPFVRGEDTSIVTRGTPTPLVRASGHIGVCVGFLRGAVAKIALPYYFTAGCVPPALTRVYIGKHEEHIFVNTSTNVYPNVHTLLHMYIQMSFTIV